MTKTIASQSDTNKRYFLTIDETGHATGCTCGDYQYRQAARNGSCKHMKSFNAEVVRAAAFLRLKASIEAQERDAERTAYLNWELSMGL